MFRWSCACYVTLAIATFATMPVHSQGHSAEQQACFDRRADKSADLDNRIAACRGVIDAAALDATIRAEAHLRRALAYAQKAAQSSNAEDIERAIADLSEGMRLDPNNPAGQRYVYLTRAGLYFHKGDHDRALVDYTALIGLEPKSAMAYGYRGSVYATIGDHERAIADYAEAIRLEPNVARLHHQRASSYLLAGKADDALADADRAVALDPNDAASYSTRVVVYRTLGKSDGVVSDLRKALLDTSNDGIREELQLAERTKSAAQPVRQGTDARIDAEASEGSTKAAAQFYNQRAWTRLQAGKAVAALPEVDRALELDATNVAYYSTRALINRTLGRDSETIADLRKALSLDPSNNGIKQELEKLEQAQIAAAEVREKERLDQLREARDAAKIKEPTETTVAAGAASAPDPVRLARDLQEELKRVGCDPGAAVDGNWSNKSQAALEKFASHAKLMLSLGEPTTAALDAVSAQKGRVCLLECDEQAVEERGQCVARPR